MIAERAVHGMNDKLLLERYVESGDGVEATSNSGSALTRGGCSPLQLQHNHREYPQTQKDLQRHQRKYRAQRYHPAIGACLDSSKS